MQMGIDTIVDPSIETFSFSYRLFIGPCNNVDTLENITKSTNVNFHKIALRFNSIKTDYQSIAGKIVSGRVIQLKACRIRVDIYNSMITLKYSVIWIEIFSYRYDKNNEILHIGSEPTLS